MAASKFSLLKFEKLKKDLQDVLKPYRDIRLSYDNILRIARRMSVCATSGKTDSGENFIIELLSGYNNRILDRDLINKLAVIAAGNKENMDAGKSYKEWSYSDGPVDTALYINSVEPHTAMRMYRCTVDCYKGTPAGMSFVLYLPKKFLQFLIREIGGKRREDYKSEDAGGLWFLASLTPRRGRLRFENIDTSDSIWKRNRHILSKRREKCIIGMYNCRCFDCYLGRDRCFLARHSDELEKGICLNREIGEHRDFLAETGYCYNCLRKNLVNNKRK